MINEDIETKIAISEANHLIYRVVHNIVIYIQQTTHLHEIFRNREKQKQDVQQWPSRISNITIVSIEVPAS